MATAAAPLEVPPTPPDPDQPTTVDLNTVGEYERAVAIHGPISSAQAVKIKKRLKRSRLIRKVNLYPEEAELDPKENGEDITLHVFAKWHWPWRNELVAKIGSTLVKELDVPELTVRIHERLPGKPFRQPVIEQTFYRLPPGINPFASLDTGNGHVTSLI